MIYEVGTVVDHEFVTIGRIKTDVPIHVGEHITMVGHSSDYVVKHVTHECERKTKSLHFVTHYTLVVEPA